MAPDGLGSTSVNGAGLPRADLHVALVAPDRKTFDLLKRVRIVQPPYWPGTVHLHVIVNPKVTEDEIQILQAAVDLGWAPADQLEIGPPPQLELGYTGADQ